MKIRLYITTIWLILLNIEFSYGQVQLEPACAESSETYGVSGFNGSDFVWSVEGGNIVNGDGTDTVTVHWGYKTGKFKLEVLEITESGCKNVPSTAEIMVRAPYVNLGTDFPEMCAGDSMVFDVGTGFQQPYQILWMNGSNNERYVADSAQQIWVKVTDGYGCTRYDTVSLFVNPLPSVNLGKDTILCDIKNPYLLDPGYFSSYSWQSSEGDFSTSTFPAYPINNSPDTIRLTVTDAKGCKGRDTLIVLPCDLTKLFTDMPNAFTPNGDGQNDTWIIPYMDIFPNAVLEIFDRWGRLVYRTTKVYGNFWDGKSKGKDLPMDAYYFVLKLNYMNAEPIVGTVNLIR